MSNTPHNLPPEQVGNELRYLHKSAELLKARITGLEEQATYALKHGKRVPGYTLAQSPGRQVWTKDPEMVDDLGLMYGIDLKKPTAVITPAQAIKAKIPEKVVNAWSCRQPGSFKLVPQTEGKKLFNEKMKE